MKYTSQGYNFRKNSLVISFVLLLYQWSKHLKMYLYLANISKETSLIQEHKLLSTIKYDKQDRQGKAAFNERSPHPTKQQAPAARSPGGPQRKIGQGIRQSTGRQTTT
jgi:hypothetical protein